MYKVFIVGFPRDMGETGLKEMFGDFGDVAAVKIITDQATAQSKGYAFIDFLDEAGANLVVKDLDGTELNGRTLNVRLADREARPRTNTERKVSERTYEKVRQKPQRRRRIQ